VYTNGLTDTNYVQPLFAGLLTLAYGIRCLRTPYNMWILAAGHYKQTQRCHVIAAVLNLVISAVTVWIWGLVGVAVGTLIAMLYQTVWMAIYNTKNLLKRPIWTVLKQFGVDILTAGGICLLAGSITLGQVTYLGWVIMAVKVGVIALAVTGLSAVVFYRKQVVALLKRRSR
jgi:O-antigen/teichoic acid export membrane protein